MVPEVGAKSPRVRLRQSSLQRWKMAKAIRCALCPVVKTTMVRLERRTSTKQRSITLVVRSCFHRRLEWLRV